MLFILSLLVIVIAFFAWQTAKKKTQFNAMYKTTANIAGAVMGFFVLVAISQCFTVVPAGNVGVVDFFGTVSDNTLKAGINFINPLARAIKFSVKTQEIKEVMDVPSKEGLMVQLEVSALFHLNPETAAEVYKTIERIMCRSSSNRSSGLWCAA